ncbi:MAG: cyanophycin synthetase [Clostridiales bacterium]|nr:cyanophycin synthetase [Clostridiales bacterium]
MRLLAVKALKGKNIYADFPVIRADICIDKTIGEFISDIEDFNKRYLKLWSRLKGYKFNDHIYQGFSKKIKMDRYIIPIIESTILEIQKILGDDLTFIKTKYLENKDVYSIIYEYKDEVLGLQSAELAVDIISSILEKKNLNIIQRLEKIKKLVSINELGTSTAAIVNEARKRQIPVTRIGNNSLIQLGYGKYSRRIQGTITDNTRCIAVDTVCDKGLTNSILRIHGLPVPQGETVSTYDEVMKAVKKLGFPVVIKPYNGNQGRGVSLNLQSFHEVRNAYNIARQYSDKILVEEYISGKNYRITVINQKVIAVAERIAAHVIGDGINNIRELINIENQNPLRGECHEKPLTKIKIDNIVLSFLKKTGKRLDYIPQKGEKVYLRGNDNLSTGGIAIDVTDKIHPDNARLAINAARAVGLDVAGVDMTTDDIEKSILDYGGAIIEINAAPGIRMHHYPSSGKSRNVAGEIIDSLFPVGVEHSIPIISVTGTNGKTTTVRMLVKIFKENNKLVGMTTTGGIYIGEEEIMRGDTTGPRSAQALLMDNRVELAVLETARGGIINKGLGYELADVGIVTNVGDDHLGIDGINTLDEMAEVKSLIIKAVKKDGHVVLNADDKYTEKLSKITKCNIIYFSKDPLNKIVKEHIQMGNKAVYTKNDDIYIFDGKKEIFVIKTHEIPATMNSILEHNIENSMAAIAGSFAMGVEIDVIYRALKDFATDVKNNLGRFNIFDVKDFKVVIDYAHNIDGYNKVLKGLNKIKKNRLVGIIGLPGDRSDISILKVAELAGKNFDYAYIKEDSDLRGRKKGEIAGLIKKGCNLGGLSDINIEIELCEIKALKKAMANAKPGDIIVIFYENYYPIIEAIEEFKNQDIKLENQSNDLNMSKEILNVSQ